jgi:hypothetical protein
MPESLGGAIVLGLDFIAERCQRTAFVPDLPRRAAAQRSMRAMLVVVVLPFTEPI